MLNSDTRTASAAQACDNIGYDALDIVTAELAVLCEPQIELRHAHQDLAAPGRPVVGQRVNGITQAVTQCPDAKARIGHELGER